jgi:hypothetical protein
MNPKKFRYGSKNDRLFFAFLAFAAMSAVGLAAEDQQRPIDGIMDNSFFVEEAYNQEPGIVQHIFVGGYSVGRLSRPGDKTFDMIITQEWPAYGQAHQVSYTVPYTFAREDEDWNDGFADVLLNYRFQAYFNEETLTAFAPRFSLVLPTGDVHQGFGRGTLGYQWNLPFSTTVGDRLFVHANAGLTYLPDAGESPTHDFLNYNLGGSVIYCLSDRLHLMLEWVGTGNETVGTSGKVDREFASLISPGLRYAFNFRNGSQLVLGLGIPLGLTDTTSDIGGVFYLSFEHRLFGKEESLTK